ncbi:riboflavin kinase [Auriscalpium vulgare]|uniref:Riboflavin kinase n=1 Tax=Auriscalpium vulgare TaxID=40419 RepID=A0ACB8R9U4_9AGAM|nr:riboflavin kinase [Auriscalpium vulgare]
MADPTVEDLQALSERPSAPVRTETSRAARPHIVGPDIPQSPFPIFLAGAVQKGFGRGGKDLGVPTANLPDESITPMTHVCQPGVYFGYAQVAGLPGEEAKVHPMVMSLGWNPFYKNERLTAEIHIMSDFKADFYQHDMKTLVLGYIRPELDYISREALIEDIQTDKRVALNSLARPGYEKFAEDAHFDL